MTRLQPTAGERIVALRPGAELAVPAPRPVAPLLTLRGVGKRYPQASKRCLQVLCAIDLDVAEGEFLSIVGASGCGKSTLLRLLVGLDADYDGTIDIDGVPVSGTSLERGIVFQEHRLLPWLTVARNVEFGLLNAGLKRAERAARVRHYIELVKLQGFEDAYPHQLSGGMAQRVAIARALAGQPRILLLDEPFGALDAMTRAHMQRELMRIWQQERITMILVTHDMDEAVYLGQRVVVMKPSPGRIGEIVPVAAAYPRDRVGEEFVRAKRHLLAAFADERDGAIQS